jgi:phosphatidylserine decarboxylase
MIKGFHKEGQTFLIGSSIVSIGLLYLAKHFLGLGIIFYLLLATVLVFLYLFFQFFRVPQRSPLQDANVIVSPCDGKVVVIEEVEEQEFLMERCIQVSIFMSPLNVHINWYPAAGEVLYEKYHPGKFLVAWHPKSSTDNERTTVAVGNEKGRYLMRQVAGAVARRIKCYSKKGDLAAQCGEMGFIKFGSRVDLYLPLDADIQVAIGDVVKGTQTPIARWA